MSSAPKQVRKDPAATDTGLFRCTECGTLFSTEDELREHEETFDHHNDSDQQELDDASNEDMTGEYDQLDGTRYPDEKRH
jgi:hypothetical protein